LQAALRTRELKGLIDNDHNFKATLSMCSRVRAKALHAIIGDYKGQFRKIRDYLYEVYKKNPGITIKVKTFKDGDDHVFKFLYICPRELERGFLDGCKRVISLNACFLKGSWNGQVFVAVGRDANNQMYMYPIAWGVAQTETREVWEWFISLMQEDLEMGDITGWTLILDQQKVNFCIMFFSSKSSIVFMCILLFHLSSLLII